MYRSIGTRRTRHVHLTMDTKDILSSTQLFIKTTSLYTSFEGCAFTCTRFPIEDTKIEQCEDPPDVHTHRISACTKSIKPLHPLHPRRRENSSCWITYRTGISFSLLSFRYLIWIIWTLGATSQNVVVESGDCPLHVPINCLHYPSVCACIICTKPYKLQAQ
jgi:hypothetical protein